MIKLICLDVDGTLTDGKLYYSNEGVEIKAFSVHDGLAIAYWMRLGRQVALISGRFSKGVEDRARELGISECHLGIRDKREIVEKLKLKFQLQTEEVACIGDDLNDLPMFKSCGLCFVPKNGMNVMKKFAFKILNQKGGDGAVREMIDLILMQEKLEDKVLEFFKK